MYFIIVIEALHAVQYRIATYWIYWQIKLNSVAYIALSYPSSINHIYRGGGHNDGFALIQPIELKLPEVRTINKVGWIARSYRLLINRKKKKIKDKNYSKLFFAP